MCKLCNTEEPSQITFNKTAKFLSETFLFRSIVNDYTNEHPCHTACLRFRSKVGVWNTSNVFNLSIEERIDRYIIYVLNNNYGKGYNREKRRIADALRNKKLKKSSKSLIETCIYLRTYPSKKTAFVVRIKNITQTFKTLEEAQQFKQGVLNGDYQHNSVAA